MKTAIYQNVSIPCHVYKRVRGFCKARNLVIYKTVARWCMESIERELRQEQGK